YRCDYPFNPVALLALGRARSTRIRSVVQARPTDNEGWTEGDPMLPEGLIRIGDSRLSVEAISVDPCIVGAFRGIADQTALKTLLEASDLLVTAPQARLVLDLQELQEATLWCAGTVARMIRQANRMGKEVYLVRCPAWFYEQLEANGLNGPVRHAGSLAAATDGLLGNSQSTLSLCLRSAPENLRRL